MTPSLPSQYSVKEGPNRQENGIQARSCLGPAQVLDEGGQLRQSSPAKYGNAINTFRGGRRLRRDIGSIEGEICQNLYDATKPTRSQSRDQEAGSAMAGYRLCRTWNPVRTLTPRTVYGDV